MNGYIILCLNTHSKVLITKWIAKVAFDIEINLINTLKDSLYYLSFYNSIFKKFQDIDSNLESIKGAKAFRDCARTMIGNQFACSLEPNYNRLSMFDIICTSEK